MEALRIILRKAFQRIILIVLLSPLLNTSKQHKNYVPILRRYSYRSDRWRWNFNKSRRISSRMESAFSFYASKLDFIVHKEREGWPKKWILEVEQQFEQKGTERIIINPFEKRSQNHPCNHSIVQAGIVNSLRSMEILSRSSHVVTPKIRAKQNRIMKF